MKAVVLQSLGRQSFKGRRVAWPTEGARRTEAGIVDKDDEHVGCTLRGFDLEPRGRCGLANIDFSNRWEIRLCYRQNCAVDGILVTAHDLLLLDDRISLELMTRGSSRKTARDPLYQAGRRHGGPARSTTERLLRQQENAAASGMKRLGFPFTSPVHDSPSSAGIAFVLMAALPDPLEGVHRKRYFPGRVVVDVSVDSGAAGQPVTA